MNWWCGSELVLITMHSTWICICHYNKCHFIVSSFLSFYNYVGVSKPKKKHSSRTAARNRIKLCLSHAGENLLIFFWFLLSLPPPLFSLPLQHPIPEKKKMKYRKNIEKFFSCQFLAWQCRTKFTQRTRGEERGGEKERYRIVCIWIEVIEEGIAFLKIAKAGNRDGIFFYCWIHQN